VIQRLADGRWLRIRHHRTRDGGWWRIRSDITDLKAREVELQRAEARLADAIEAMPEGFMLWNPDDRLVVHNGALGRVDPAAYEIATARPGLHRFPARACRPRRHPGRRCRGGGVRA